MATAAALLIALVIATTMGVLWRQSEAAKEEAVAEARRAEAAKLLAIAQLQLETDPTEALAYATASLELADTREARLVALRTLWTGPPALVNATVLTNVMGMSFSPDEEYIALGSRSEDVLVLAEEGGPPLILPGHQSKTNYPNHASWASNELLVTGSEETDRARIWSIPSGELLREIDLGDFAFFESHPNGYLLAEVLEPPPPPWDSTEFYHLRRWRLPDGEVEELGTVDLASLGGHPSSGFTADGSAWFYTKGSEIYLRELPIREGVPDRFAGRHENKLWWPSKSDTLNRLWTQDTVTEELRLWDLSDPSGEPLRIIDRPAGLEDGVPFSPLDFTGRWSHSITREVRIWDSDGWPEARPLRLRRSGSWTASKATMHPQGNWLVAGGEGQELNFWPLERPRPRVVDGYLGQYSRPLAFSPDGQWLATSWGDWKELRLWPLPGNDQQEPRTLPLPVRQVWFRFVFDPKMRFMVPLGGPSDHIDILPLDGSPPDRLEGFSENSITVAGALSPSGRLLVTAPSRNGPWTLRVWDLETGELRLLDLPDSTSSSTAGRARGVWFMAFTDESTLYTSGDGGVRRWDLERGSWESVLAAPADHGTRMKLAADGRTAIVSDVQLDDYPQYTSGTLRLLDLGTGEARELPGFGNEFFRFSLDPSGTIVATNSADGIIRVGRVDAKEPHLLLGHEGVVERVAISPDGQWVASSGEDNTLRLWPMPDLDKPPLHKLLHDELIAKLKSLTNLRAVRDPESSTGWSIEIDPFPGWKEVPTW